MCTLCQCGAASCDAHRCDVIAGIRRGDIGGECSAIGYAVVASSDGAVGAIGFDGVTFCVIDIDEVDVAVSFGDIE